MEDLDSKIRTEALPKQDEYAKAEIESVERKRDIEEKTLDSLGRKKEYERKEKLRDVFGMGARCLLGLGFFIVGISLMLVAWHYLTPDSWHWMLGDRLDTMRTALFSGGLFAFLGLYVRDRI